MKTILCPECNGSGEVVGMFPVYSEDVPAEKRKPFVNLRCLLCLGEGGVADGYKDRALRGQKARQVRIEHDLSLREFCTRFDVNTVELSRYERGCDVKEDVIQRIERALSMVSCRWGSSSLRFTRVGNLLRAKKLTLWFQDWGDTEIFIEDNRNDPN